MYTTIEELIAKKPHLKEPLRFYEKTIQFTDAVRELGFSTHLDQKAYPPRLTGSIIERFESVFELPAGSLSPLIQALELGEIDFTRLPLLEVPAFSLPYPEDDLTALLFLLSRPFFLGRHDILQRENCFWEKGVCPVCSARPSLSTVPREGRWQLFCSFCGTKGPYDSPGCPICFNRDGERLRTFLFEEEEGVAVLACDSCKAYVKTADDRVFARITPALLDLVSLPLDIAVQQKGYKRLSPNPLGMVRMSANG